MNISAADSMRVQFSSVQPQKSCKRWRSYLQDTLFDHLVFKPSQFLHHDVDETGDEAGQKANQTTDHPATDLQTSETLKI